MRPTTRTLVLRALLAISLMIAFYALALAIAAALGFAGSTILLAVLDFRGRAALFALLLGVGMWIAAGVIAWSIIPRIDRFTPPGPELVRGDAPALFDVIADVARATGQAEPRHVYLVPDVNAFVTERGGVMGLGSQRVMGVGLPLLELLTVAELRAVIAHEFGHFDGGDTKLGPWIYKIRGAMGRTIANLEAAAHGSHQMSDTLGWMLRALRMPFVWFTRLSLRITQAISRQQERDADALACRVAGSRALAEGLKKLHGGALAFDAFYRSEVGMVIAAGRMPPLADGFSSFRANGKLHEAIQRAIGDELASSQTDPFDSHPPLRERVDAAESLAAPSRDEDAREALALVPDVAALEARLVPFLSDAPLAPIEWSEVPAEVILPQWRTHQPKIAGALAGTTPADLPRGRAALLPLCARALGFDPAEIVETTDEELHEWASSFYGTAIALVLADRGHRPECDPGQPLLLRRGREAIDPIALARAWISGELDPGAWRARLQALGIADVDLAALTPAAPATPPA